MAPKTPSVEIPVVTKNLRALHGALEHSLTIQRTRLQQIVDDLVSRGSLTRADADGLLNQLLASSKDYSQALLHVIDNIAASTRQTVGEGIAPVVATAGRTAGKLAETVRSTTGLPMKTGTKTGSKTGSKAGTKAGSKTSKAAAADPAADVVPNEPIAGYSQLTVAEIKPRLNGLSPAALRKVRDAEMAGKARKTVLADIEQRLKG